MRNIIILYLKELENSFSNGPQLDSRRSFGIEKKED